MQLLILALALLLSSCAQSKTAFDSQAYEKNVERTVDESFKQRLSGPY